MKIEFDLQESDYRTFSEYHFWYSPDRKAFRIKRRLYLGGISVFFLILFLWMGEREVTDGLILYTILMSVMLFAFGFFYAKYSLLLRVNKSIRKMLKEGKNKDLLGRRTMEFTSDKIICHTEHSDSVSDVKLVEKFREDEYAFYLYTSAIQAYMIPKRVLGKQDKLDLENWVRSLDL